MLIKKFLILLVVLFTSACAFVQEKPSTVQKNDPFSFTVFVDYQTPRYTQLEAAFEHVSPDYEEVVFKKTDENRTPRELVFELLHTPKGCDITTDDIYKEADRRGVRMANYEELIAFDRAVPHQQYYYNIVALGSCGHISDKHYAPAIGKYIISHDPVEKSVRSIGLVDTNWRNAYGGWCTFTVLTVRN